MSDEEAKKEVRPESDPDTEVGDDVVEFEFNEDGEEDLKKTLKNISYKHSPQVLPS